MDGQRTWIDISRSALRTNLNILRHIVGPSVGIMPIVKANAYGHGLQQVITALPKGQIWAYGVAYGSEAIELREIEKKAKIVVLSAWQSAELPALIRANVELVVWDPQSWGQVIRASRRIGRWPKIHIKLDTGTHRIGFQPEDKNFLRRAVQQYPNIAGVFSHFANAEDRSGRPTLDQLKIFTTLRNSLGLTRGVSHIACTAALLREPTSHLDVIRPGIGLYGLWPTPALASTYHRQFPLRPAMHWQTRIEQLKQLPSGTPIGYGGTVVTKRVTQLAVLPVGYADGYPRSLSNRGWVMINGRRAPVMGRICMNLMMVDTTGMRQVQVGDVVSVMGGPVNLGTLATAAGTIHYELVARLDRQIPRRLVV